MAARAAAALAWDRCPPTMSPAAAGPRLGSASWAASGTTRRPSSSPAKTERASCTGQHLHILPLLTGAASGALTLAGEALSTSSATGKAHVGSSRWLATFRPSRSCPRPGTSIAPAEARCRGAGGCAGEITLHTGHKIFKGTYIATGVTLTTRCLGVLSAPTAVVCRRAKSATRGTPAASAGGATSGIGTPSSAALALGARSQGALGGSKLKAYRLPAAPMHGRQVAARHRVTERSRRAHSPHGLELEEPGYVGTLGRSALEAPTNEGDEVW